jgi:hypothetical protein
MAGAAATGPRFVALGSTLAEWEEAWAAGAALTIEEAAAEVLGT